MSYRLEPKTAHWNYNATTEFNGILREVKAALKAVLCSKFFSNVTV